MRATVAVLLASLAGALALKHVVEGAPAAPELGTSPDERAFAAVASEIAQRKVSIHCGGQMPAYEGGRTLGFVPLLENGEPADYAVLAADVCADLSRFRKGLSSADSVCLRRWRRGCSKTVVGAAHGLHVLAHETYHLAGVHDESAAECYGLQGLSYVARRLGATRAEADALVVYAVAHAKQGLPPEYHSPDCREGGRYDLRPGTKGFFG